MKQQQFTTFSKQTADGKTSVHALGSWRVACNYLDPNAGATVRVRQVHGTHIVQAEEAATKQLTADAIVLTDARYAAAIYTADCVPLAVCTNGLAVLAHISRHNLAAGILETLAQHISFARVSEVYLGPHICPQHYQFEQVTADVQKLFKKFPAAVTTSSATASFSLHDAIVPWLMAQGYRGTVTQDARCTYEEQTLASYRHWQKETTDTPLGRNVTYLWLQSSLS